MKPLQLTLTNFGPFINETIDFQQLSAASLFLISGKTGAGKTTIFDGMTYALFGETSGALRSGKDMRSTFASPEEETAVHFRFEHQELIYDIIRKPEQQLAKKKGTGEKKQTAKVSLTLLNQQQEELRQFTKRTEVDSMIKELLHLDAKQFSQIVLLPQGEFRTFLIANSKEKESVLRHLFGTQMYQQLTEELKGKLKEKTAANQKLLDKLDYLAGQVEWATELQETVSHAEILALLTEQQEQASKQIQLIEQDLAALRVQQQQAEKCYYDGEQLADDFQQLAQLELEKQALQAAASEMQQLKQRVSELQWLEGHRALTEQLQRSQQQLTALKERQKGLVVQEEHYQQEQAEWQAEEAAAADWKQQQEADLKRLQQLEGLLPLAVQQQQVQQTLQQLENTHNELQQQAQQLQQQSAAVTAESDELKQVTQQREAWRQTQLQLMTLQQQLMECKKTDELLTATVSQKDQLVYRQQEQQQAIEQQEQELEQRRIEQTNSKSMWAEMQIARLSVHLKDGKPCPVCGALEHPKAAAKTQHYTSEDVQAAEQQVADVDEAVLVLEKTIATQREQLKQGAVRLTELRNEEQQQQETLEKGLAQAVKLLPAAYQIAEAVTIDGFRQRVEQLEENHTAQGKQLDSQETRLVELQQQLKTLAEQQTQQELEQRELDNQLQKQIGLLEGVSNQLGTYTLSELQQEQEQLMQRQTGLLQRINEYQEQGQALERQQQLLRQQQQVLLGEKQSLETILAEQEQQLQQELQQQGLTYELFLEKLSETAAISVLQQQLTEYEKRQAIYDNRQQQLQEKVRDKEPPQVEQLRERLEQVKQQVINQQEQLSQQQAVYQLNQRVLSELQAAYQSSQQQMKELSELQQLSQVMNGENDFKLSVERYVLQTYLQEVLQVANERLGRLTKGRYQFELASKTGSYRNQTGLEINIYDDNAGASRSAHTLSGGESFIAALALALSLAEVIQYQSGGIAIEALFIDEGFGSLDEESLEMAMEALETIENEGRMIGIISHVRELKDRIPQQIHVVAGGSGQSTIQYQIV